MVSEYLREKYNPDRRAAMAIVIGSSFILALFLITPDFSTPFYVAGLAVTVLTLIAAVAIVVFEMER